MWFIILWSFLCFSGLPIRIFEKTPLQINWRKCVFFSHHLFSGFSFFRICHPWSQSCRIEAHIVCFCHGSALCVHKTRIRIEIVRSYSIRVLLVPRWHQDAIGSLDTGSTTLNHAGLEQFSSVWIMNALGVHKPNGNYKSLVRLRNRAIWAFVWQFLVLG